MTGWSGRSPATRHSSMSCSAPSAEPALEDVADALAIAASLGVAGLDAFDQALRRSPARAAGLAALEQKLLAAQVFSVDWLAGASRSARSGQPFAEMAQELESSIDTLEGVVRVQTGLAKLQPGRACGAVAARRAVRRRARGWGGAAEGRARPGDHPQARRRPRCSRTWTAGGSAPASSGTARWRRKSATSSATRSSTTGSASSRSVCWPTPARG